MYRSLIALIIVIGSLVVPAVVNAGDQTELSIYLIDTSALLESGAPNYTITVDIETDVFSVTDNESGTVTVSGDYQFFAQAVWLEGLHVEAVEGVLHILTVKKFTYSSDTGSYGNIYGGETTSLLYNPTRAREYYQPMLGDMSEPGTLHMEVRDERLIITGDLVVDGDTLTTLTLFQGTRISVVVEGKEVDVELGVFPDSGYQYVGVAVRDGYLRYYSAEVRGRFMFAGKGIDATIPVLDGKISFTVSIQ